MVLPLFCAIVGTLFADLPNCILLQKNVSLPHSPAFGNLCFGNKKYQSQCKSKLFGKEKGREVRLYYEDNKTNTSAEKKLIKKTKFLLTTEY